MSKITISKKHGVNPTIPCCFFCKNPKNEIALLGRLPGDVEAPRNAVIDYEPCEECKEHWKDGLVLIGVLKEPIMEGQPPIVPNLYPTGNYAVVKKDKEALKELFNVPETEIEEAIKMGKVFVDEPIIVKLAEIYARKKEE